VDRFLIERPAEVAQKLEDQDVNRSYGILKAVLLLLALVSTAGVARGQGAGLTVKASGADKPPRFYGFTGEITFADASGLNGVGQNYRNDLTWYFQPRWQIGRMFLRGTRWAGLTLAARFIVTQNLTGVDPQNFSGNGGPSPMGTCGVLDPTTVGYCNYEQPARRTDYSDLWLTLAAPRIYTIPKLGLNLNPSLRFILPTSLQSRQANTVMSITAFLGLGRAFFNGKWRVGYSFGFNKWFQTQPTGSRPYSNGQVVVQGGNPWDGGAGANLANFLLDPTSGSAVDRSGEGTWNTNFTLQNIFSTGVQLHEKVSFDLLYFTGSSQGVTGPCTVQVQGYTIDTCATGAAVASSSGTWLDRPGWRHSQVLWASLDYNPLDWLTLTLAYITVAPMYHPNGTYQQAIISADYNAYTTVQLGATFAIDGIAAKVIKERKN
jgi:hypothetical protein